MHRRQFLETGVAGLVLSAAAGTTVCATGFDEDKVRRVGLIGCGWYGKADLLRLI